jgi:hypothetical protein
MFLLGLTMLRKNTQKVFLSQKIINSIVIDVPPILLEKLMSFLIMKKKKDLIMYGFENGNIPYEYIKIHYHDSLQGHLEHIFYHFYAHDILVKQLRKHGSYIPKLFELNCLIDLKNEKISFVYDYIDKLLDYDVMPDFKKLKFPERKKYRDLDRQAKLIIESEEKNKQTVSSLYIEEGDWIGIRIYMSDGEAIIDNQLSLKMWLHITNESIDKEIRDVFLKKKLKDHFFCNAFFLNELLSTNFITHMFYIEIEDHVSKNYFCFDGFKEAFGYDNKDVFEKIIDIFSLRNDVSLKKEKTQMTLRYFLEKIKIHIEPQIIKEHELIIQSKIIKNPDYLLYQSDSNFTLNIKRLACRQGMEKILIDYFIHIFHIKSNDNLLHWYLNILQRHRLKDFLYFDISHVYDNSNKSTLIKNSMIEQMALREKTIEFLIKKSS